MTRFLQLKRPRIAIWVAILALLVILDLSGTWAYHRLSVGIPTVGTPTGRTPGGSPLVVLCAGAGELGGLDRATVERLAFAAREHRQRRANRIIAIGCHWERNLERPDVMASELRRRGVPTAGILHDRDSFETLTNLRALKVIMERHQIPRAIIVSSPLHLLRVRRLAQRMGLSHRLGYRPFSARHQRSRARIWLEVHHEWAATVAFAVLPESLYLGVMQRSRRGR